MASRRGTWVLPVVVAMTLTACGGSEPEPEEDPQPSSVTTAEATEQHLQYRALPATCLMQPSAQGLTPDQVAEANLSDRDLVAPWLHGQDDENLEEALNSAVEGARADLDTEIGVVVSNHSTGETVQINQDSPIRAASLSKVPVALTFMRHLLESESELTPDDRALLEDSLVNSGNESTATLFGSLGENDDAAAAELTRTYRMLGATGPTPDGGWGTEITSAADQSKVIFALSSTPDWVRQEDMDVIRELMSPGLGYPSYTQQFGVGVLAVAESAPESTDITDVTVKNGWLPDDDGRWNVSTVGQATVNGEPHDIAITTFGAPNPECGYDLLDDLALIIAEKAN